MMSAASVSVITAAYKTDPTQLRTAISSALTQSYRDLDMIVSDDSPDDRLREIVEGFQDPRIRYRRNVPALGVAENHWRCLRDAEGEFIVILNHDDILEPEFVERLAGALRSHAGSSLAFCDHWIIDADGRRRVEKTDAVSRQYGRSELAQGEHRPFLDLLARQAIPMAMGSMFRRASLPSSLPVDAGPAYDLWLSYLLSRDGSGAYYVAERLSSWRAHASNLTAARNIDLLRGAARCWATIAEDRGFLAIRHAVLRNESLAYYACARWYFRHGHSKEGRECVWRSLRARAHWRALLLYAIGTLPSSISRRIL
jgi:glycosyltransferase involved in cell wall biosynthesis